MSRRFNKYGFSLSQMRRLFGSGDHEALQLLHNAIAAKFQYDQTESKKQDVIAVVDRAVISGMPFPELQSETWLHQVAAEVLGLHGQQWLMNYSSLLEDASILEEGLWGKYRNLASPETRAFLRGITEGIPMFGREPASDGTHYGAVGLDRLRVFQPGLRDLADLLTYRLGRKKSASDSDRHVVAFAVEFCDWLDQLIAVERDLFFSFG